MKLIVRHPSSILNTPTEPITDFSDLPINELRNALSGTTESVGIAANQIGISKSICLIKPPEWDKSMILVNPKIVRQYGRKWSCLEGCLSLPDDLRWVLRYWNIEVKYQDENGKHNKMKLNGNVAQICAHEVSHLEGIGIWNPRK